MKCMHTCSLITIGSFNKTVAMLKRCAWTPQCSLQIPTMRMHIVQHQWCLTVRFMMKLLLHYTLCCFSWRKRNTHNSAPEQHNCQTFFLHALIFPQENMIHAPTVSHLQLCKNKNHTLFAYMHNIVQRRLGESSLVTVLRARMRSQLALTKY